MVQKSSLRWELRCLAGRSQNDTLLRFQGNGGRARSHLGIETKGQPEDFALKLTWKKRTSSDALELQVKISDHKTWEAKKRRHRVVPPLTNDPTWIIDPIDGTHQLAAGLPL
jgi:hypothetical protein